MKPTPLFTALLALLGLPSPCAADPAPADERPEITPALIDRLLQDAKASNPGIEASSARADAAYAGSDAVRKWDDPTVSLGLWHSTPRGMNASQEGNIIYAIRQPLPVFGRPELRRGVADAEVARARLDLSYATQVLRRDLTVTLVELAYADRSLELAREDLSWLEQTVSAVDSRYRVGKSSQVEWLKAQTERAKAADNIKTLVLDREHQQVQINRLLNRNPHTLWPRFAMPALAGPVPYDDHLVRDALDLAPKLKVMRQQTEESGAMAMLTKSSRMPEIGVGLEARQYSGDAGIREGAFTVDFTLPWVNARQYDSDLRRELANKRAKERDAADYELLIREEVHRLTMDLDTARRQALLYQDEVIPLTEQTLSSADSAWQSGLGAFQDVLDSHRMLIENRLAQARAVADQAGKLADLTLLTGVFDLTSSASAYSPAETHH
jgi:cobalt-zinc-cadmium efflux system outer membrane protein